MKNMFILLIALAMCGCNHSNEYINADVYDAEVDGHTYIIFESRNGDIAVEHHPDCETCKNKIING